MTTSRDIGVSLYLGTEVAMIKDDECQIELESKAYGAASDTGSHSPASSHHSTHSGGISVIAHSRSAANTPSRDRLGRNSDSGKNYTCIYIT